MREVMDGLELIKQVNLKILDEIKRVCEELDIQWFLLAGTMLGAVREHDFISWDDDADVGMLRKDYEQFLAKAPALLQPEFELVLPEDMNGFYDMIAKVTIKGSRLHDANEEDAFYGGKNARISVDLYVLDAAAPSKIAFAYQIFRLKMCYGMMMHYRYQVKDVKYSLIEKAQVVTLTSLGRFQKLSSLRRKYTRICRAYEKKEQSQSYFVSNSVLQKIHVLYDQDWYEKMMDVVLRDRTYPIPVAYQQILQARYGEDYMTAKREKFTIDHAVLDQVWVE